jgi:hypothetical protein
MNNAKAGRLNVSRAENLKLKLTYRSFLKQLSHVFIDLRNRITFIFRLFMVWWSFVTSPVSGEKGWVSARRMLK